MLRFQYIKDTMVSNYELYKNERKYLEYLLDKLASCSFDELNNFVELDEDGKDYFMKFINN